MKPYLTLNFDQISLLAGAVDHEIQNMRDWKNSQLKYGGRRADGSVTWGVSDAQERIDGLKKLAKRLKKLEEYSIRETRRKDDKKD